VSKTSYVEEKKMKRMNPEMDVLFAKRENLTFLKKSEENSGKPA
jgi:hypothetical protein